MCSRKWKEISYKTALLIHLVCLSGSDAGKPRTRETAVESGEEGAGLRGKFWEIGENNELKV